MRLNQPWQVLIGTALIVLATVARSASAQSFEVVPPANAANTGGSNNRIPIGSSNGGTYQVLYPPSQLVGLPIGGKITSIQLRLWNSETSNWPPVSSTIASYEIKMGGSTRTTTTLSATFADNITSPVIVRSGALNLAAAAYPADAPLGSTPEGWGPVIAFSTPYTYKGGPLVIEFRNTGTSTAAFGEAVASTTLGGAVGTTTSHTATTGNLNAGAIVVRLGVTAPSTQAVTLPNANDTVAGSSGNYIPLAASTGGRHLTLYSADQLGSIPPGSLITGLQLRQRNAETTSWPPSDFICPSYEIWLSQSALTPGSISTTFANNLLNSVQVRSGARLAAANEYPGGAAAGATPEGWGPVIAFDTPYVYQGGVLGVEYRNTGGPALIHFADALSNGSTAAGIGATDSPNSPTGFTVSGAIIVRLSYVPPVESPFGDGVTKVYALKQFADTSAGDLQLVLTQNIDRTAQFLFGPEQFQTVGPGTLLTGVAFRNGTNVAWPPALASYPQFDIRMSRSPLTPSTMSNTVASNSGADALTVRSGSLGVNAGSLAAAPLSGTAPFTWEVPFTEGYPYRAGTLDMLVNRQALPGSSVALDAMTSTDVTLQPFGRGRFSTGNAAVTTNSSGNVPVMRFSADAQVLVPNSLKDGVGFAATFNTSAPTSTSETTFQVVLGASELSYVPVGGLITSLSFAAHTSQAAWPSATGAHADDLAVEVSSAANPPQSMSTTFAENAGADALVVRSGPIAWQPGDLPAGSTGRFGATITFDRGFVYKGGPLCITIRHAPVINGGPTLRSAQPASATRAAFNTGDKTASSGNLFSNAGPAIRLGYIASDVSPRSARSSDGTGGSRFLFGGLRSYQMLYNADQVGVPVGATISGVSFRIDNDDAAPFFPAADFTLDRFDITMSTATTSADTMSTTFASNEGADVAEVRSGPLVILKGSYPAFASDRPFGLFIPFTRPFVYKGGPLTMLIRSGNPSGASTDVLFDASLNGAAGVRNLSDPNALSGSSGTGGIIARFAFTDDAFCPADLNNDGVVDDLDFQVFAVAYDILDCKDAGMAFGCTSDLNYDGIVNDDDFLPFVQAYNEVLCP